MFVIALIVRTAHGRNPVGDLNNDGVVSAPDFLIIDTADAVGPPFLGPPCLVPLFDGVNPTYCTALKSLLRAQQNAGGVFDCGGAAADPNTGATPFGKGYLGFRDERPGSTVYGADAYISPTFPDLCVTSGNLQTSFVATWVGVAGDRGFQVGYMCGQNLPSRADEPMTGHPDAPASPAQWSFISMYYEVVDSIYLPPTPQGYLREFGPAPCTEDGLSTLYRCWFDGSRAITFWIDALACPGDPDYHGIQSVYRDQTDAWGPNRSPLFVADWVHEVTRRGDRAPGSISSPSFWLLCRRRHTYTNSPFGGWVVMDFSNHEPLNFRRADWDIQWIGTRSEVDPDTFYTWDRRP